MVDISGLDIGLVITNVAALLKAIQSNARARDIEDDRKATKENLDVWKREVEMKLEAHAQSLAEGNARFEKSDAKMDQVEKKIDEANSKIDRLLGFLDAFMVGRKKEIT